MTDKSLPQLDEISAETQAKYFKAAERSRSLAQGSADYARRALRSPEKAAEHEKTVQKRNAGISRYTKRYNERNPRPEVTARPASAPYKPLGGRDSASGKSYSEEVENPYQLQEVSAELAKSYLERSKAAGAKDLSQVSRRFAGSMRANGAIHRDELKKMGDRLAQQRKDLGLQQKDVAEESKGLYYYVNKRKVAGTSRPANHPDAPTAQDWKNAAKTAKNESAEPIAELTIAKLNKYIQRATGEHGHYNMARRNTTGDAQKEFARKENKRQRGISKAFDKIDAKNESTTMKTLTQIITEAAAKIHPDAIHVKPVNVNGQQKYHVQAVGANHAEHIKVGEHLSDSELDDFSEMGGKIKNVK